MVVASYLFGPCAAPPDYGVAPERCKAIADLGLQKQRVHALLFNGAPTHHFARKFKSRKSVSASRDLYKAQLKTRVIFAAGGVKYAIQEYEGRHRRDMYVGACEFGELVLLSAGSSLEVVQLDHQNKAVEKLSGDLLTIGPEIK